MYTVEFYYNTKDNLIKDHAKNYKYFKNAYKAAEKFVGFNCNLSAHIYRINESVDLLVGIYYNTVIWHTDKP